VRKEMMKMNKKYSIVAIALIAVLCVGVAYAAFTVTSNTAHVDMRYNVSLTAIPRGSYPSVIDLVAIVTSVGGYGKSVPVDFYYSFNSGAWTLITTVTADGSGNAATAYTVTSAGIYDFEAIANIP